MLHPQKFPTSPTSMLPNHHLQGINRRIDNIRPRNTTRRHTDRIRQLTTRAQSRHQKSPANKGQHRRCAHTNQVTLRRTLHSRDPRQINRRSQQLIRQQSRLRRIIRMITRYNTARPNLATKSTIATRQRHVQKMPTLNNHNLPILHRTPHPIPRSVRRRR